MIFSGSWEVGKLFLFVFSQDKEVYYTFDVAKAIAQILPSSPTEVGLLARSIVKKHLLISKKLALFSVVALL